MVLWPLRQAFGIVLFAIFGGFAAFGGFIVIGGVIFAAVASFVRWSRFSWVVEGGTLVIEQGLLQRKRRVIPADRIQSVDLIRSIGHRVFGVVQVRVEAIGGDDTEGLLEALDPPTAYGIQQALLGDRAPAAPDGVVVPRGPDAVEQIGRSHDGSPVPSGVAPTAETGTATDRSAPRLLAKVAPKQLVLAGLTGGRVGVAAVIFGGLSQVFGDQWFGGFSFGSNPVGEALAERAESLAAGAGVVVGALAVVAGAAVIFAISVVATAVSYWDFTVMRDGAARPRSGESPTGPGPEGRATLSGELRVSRGLLEQRLETVPLRRIQALRIEQNLVRRWLGLASVHADLAGRVGDSASASGLLLPIGTLEEARVLVADLLGDDRPVGAELQPAPPRSRRRFAIRALWWVLIAAASVVWVLLPPLSWPWWVIPIASVAVGVVALVLNLAAWRALGRAEVHGVLVSRSGVLVRRRVHVPVARIQTMSMTASPFQRRRQLTDIEIGIARSGGLAGPTVAEVDAAEARELVATATREAVEASRVSPH